MDLRRPGIRMYVWCDWTSSTVHVFVLATSASQIQYQDAATEGGLINYCTVRPREKWLYMEKLTILFYSLSALSRSA